MTSKAIDRLNSQYSKNVVCCCNLLLQHWLFFKAASLFVMLSQAIEVVSRGSANIAIDPFLERACTHSCIVQCDVTIYILSRLNINLNLLLTFNFQSSAPITKQPLETWLNTRILMQYTSIRNLLTCYGTRAISQMSNFNQFINS